jgi:hypothetical protein
MGPPGTGLHTQTETLLFAARCAGCADTKDRTAAQRRKTAAVDPGTACNVYTTTTASPVPSCFFSDALSSLQICPLLHNSSCTLQTATPTPQGRRSGTQSFSSTPGGLGLGGSCSKMTDHSLRHFCIALCVFLFVIFSLICLRKKCKNK